MPQIKIGFDKIPIPTTKTFVPLYDIVKGVPLRDANNNIIVTEDEGPLASLSKAENSLSVSVNNDERNFVIMEEQFAETSEVSTTLLGIPRAETQLSLFSDVSTYGRNEEEWEFFQFNGVFGRPAGWYNRRNRTYGEHFFTRLVENTNEQALTIESFPVAYTFAEGPNYPDYGIQSFGRLRLFIELGNYLYQEFVGAYPNFANNNFLDPNIVYSSAQDVEYPDGADEQLGYDLIENWCQAWMNMRDGLLLHPGTGDPIPFPSGYDATNTRPGAGSGANYFGQLTSKKAYRYQPGRISGFTFGFRCSVDERSTSNFIEWGIGNTTDQYVFQVNGPNFNIVRRSTVPLPEAVLNRMGFQLSDQEEVTSREPYNDDTFYELKITRDFFNGDPVNGNGLSGYLLDPTRVTMYKIEFGWYGAIGAKFYAYVPVDNGDARWVLMHQLNIENQLGEPCLQDPFFKFLYVQDIRDTSSIREPQYLYKYGASCYIDGGDNSGGYIYSYNSDENIVSSARHVSLAGIYPKQSIKNRDGSSSAVGNEPRTGYAKPNKKNVYPIDVKVDCDQLTEIKIEEVEGCPLFGHHYAPSLHSVENGISRSINLGENLADFTINPKDPVAITAISLANPIIITTTSDHYCFEGSKITVEDVVGTVELNNQTYYVDNVASNQVALYGDPELTIGIDGSSMTTYTSGGNVICNPILREQDDDAKLIVNGIWSTYANRSTEDGAVLDRIGLDGLYIKSTRPLDTTISYNGVETATTALDLTDVRFTSFYDAMAGATYPITGDGFDFNFLNPATKTGTGHFGEFLVGVSEYLPKIATRTDALGNPREFFAFEVPQGGGGSIDVKPNLNDLLYLEYTHSSIYRTRDGFEQTEGDAPAGIRFDIDYRLPRPEGTDSGSCSGFRIDILDREDYGVTFQTTNPASGAGAAGGFVIFNERPDALLSYNLTGGEFGIDDAPSGVRFVGIIQTFEQNNEIKYYIEVDSNPNSGAFIMNLTPIRIADRSTNGDPEKKQSKTRLFSYQPKPLYAVVFMRDGARVNNCTITETINDTVRAFCPNWVTNDGVSVVGSGNSQQGVPAATYIETERLASASVDTQNTQPLRPGKLKDTIYVSPLDNNTIDLKSVYGSDRTTITPGLLNTTATFFTGRSMINNDVNIVSVSVNTREV
jgi:hypothetical protein